MNHTTNIYFGSEEITKEIFAKLDHLHKHMLQQDDKILIINDMVCKVLKNQADANSGELDKVIKRLQKITRQIRKIVE